MLMRNVAVQLSCSSYRSEFVSPVPSELTAIGDVVVRAATEELKMKASIILVAAGLTLAGSIANAEEARVGVGVGPVGAGVTVGQSPSHERRTTVIREREPRDSSVVIRKERREPRDKTIIHERD
jgi:hypothetical protein